ARHPGEFAETPGTPSRERRTEVFRPVANGTVMDAAAGNMDGARTILPGSERNAADAKLVGKTDPASTVAVTVVLARRAEIPDATLQRCAHALPAARPALGHAQFAALYGAADDGIAAVRAFATAFGLSVVAVDQARRVVQLGG